MRSDEERKAEERIMSAVNKAVADAYTMGHAAGFLEGYKMASRAGTTDARPDGMNNQNRPQAQPDTSNTHIQRRDGETDEQYQTRVREARDAQPKRDPSTAAPVPPLQGPSVERK